MGITVKEDQINMPGNHTKRYSNMQEKRIAKMMGGETQPASGALPIASKKGDVRSNKSENWKLLIDGKTTMAKTYQEGVRSKVLHKDELLKVEQQAREGGYDIGVLAISFDNKTDYYVVKDIDFRNMYDALRDYEIMVDKLETQLSELRAKIAALQKAEPISRPRFAEIVLED
jgi:hypothetical protein